MLSRPQCTSCVLLVFLSIICAILLYFIFFQNKATENMTIILTVCLLGSLFLAVIYGYSQRKELTLTASRSFNVIATAIENSQPQHNDRLSDRPPSYRMTWRKSFFERIMKTTNPDLVKVHSVRRLDSLPGADQGSSSNETKTNSNPRFETPGLHMERVSSLPTYSQAMFNVLADEDIDDINETHIKSDAA